MFTSPNQFLLDRGIGPVVFDATVLTKRFVGFFFWIQLFPHQSLLKVVLNTINQTKH